MKQGEYYFSADRKVFEVLELYTQNDAPWVRFNNTETLQEYTCLQDAFLARYSLQPN
jgi:hypothetical protein